MNLHQLEARRLLKFDPNQPRADDGKWTDGGGPKGRSAEDVNLIAHSAMLSITAENRDEAKLQFERTMTRYMGEKVRVEDELFDDLVKKYKAKPVRPKTKSKLWKAVKFVGKVAAFLIAVQFTRGLILGVAAGAGLHKAEKKPSEAEATKFFNFILGVLTDDQINKLADQLEKKGVKKTCEAEARRLLKAGFDPNQERDDHGRWTDDGGGGSITSNFGDSRGGGGRVDVSAASSSPKNRDWDDLSRSEKHARIADRFLDLDTKASAFGENPEIKQAAEKNIQRLMNMQRSNPEGFNESMKAWHNAQKMKADTAARSAEADKLSGEKNAERAKMSENEKLQADISEALKHQPSGKLRASIAKLSDRTMAAAKVALDVAEGLATSEAGEGSSKAKRAAALAGSLLAISSALSLAIRSHDAGTIIGHVKRGFKSGKNVKSEAEAVHGDVKETIKGLRQRTASLESKFKSAYSQILRSKALRAAETRALRGAFRATGGSFVTRGKTTSTSSLRPQRGGSNLARRRRAGTSK